MLKRLFIICRLVASAHVVEFEGNDAPQWLQQAAAIKVPTYDRDVQAVVLLNDEQVTVSSDGHVTTVTTFAVRILAHEGRAYAMAAVPYLTDSGKVRDLQAWLVRSSGDITHFGKDDILDVISDPN